MSSNTDSSKNPEPLHERELEMRKGAARSEWAQGGFGSQPAGGNGAKPPPLAGRDGRERAGNGQTAPTSDPIPDFLRRNPESPTWKKLDEEAATKSVAESEAAPTNDPGPQAFADNVAASCGDGAGPPTPSVGAGDRGRVTEVSSGESQDQEAAKATAAPTIKSKAAPAPDEELNNKAIVETANRAPQPASGLNGGRAPTEVVEPQQQIGNNTLGRVLPATKPTAIVPGVRECAGRTHGAAEMGDVALRPQGRQAEARQGAVPDERKTRQDE
jgi:hypothetical protein